MIPLTASQSILLHISDHVNSDIVAILHYCVQGHVKLSNCHLVWMHDFVFPKTKLISYLFSVFLNEKWGGSPGTVVKAACLENQRSLVRTALWPSLLKCNIIGSLRDQDVAFSTSDHKSSNFESCVGMAVSSYSCQHPEEVLLSQFSLYVHTSVLNQIHFIWCERKTSWNCLRM